MMRLVLILVLVFVSNIITARSDELTDIFEHANQLYIEKNYAAAVNEYQKLIDKGVQSAEVYYNLANAYYRLRQTAEAIYYYEKAKKVKPDDEDIQFNLNVANLRVVDKFPEVPKFFLTEWYEGLVNKTDSDTWALWSVISIWVAMILLIAFLFLWDPKLKKLFFAGAVLFVFIGIFSLFLTYARVKIETEVREAIVFAPSVYVKSSPEENSTDLFILHEGTKIKIQDKIGEWYEIKLPNGSIGWMPAKDLRIL